MSDNLILDFPVLQEGRNDFAKDVSYQVEANIVDSKYVVEHILSGQSFIRQLINDGKAKFSVKLLYRDSSERQFFCCGADANEISADLIKVKQFISSKFSYAPEIMPSIVIEEGKKFTVNSSDNLTDFWSGEIVIPKYSRIAIHPKIKFTSGGIAHLMQLKYDDKIREGTMRVEVSKNAGEGVTPATLHCAQDVYQELKKIKKDGIRPDIKEAMRMAIITQALCAIYAYMKEPSQEEKSEGYELGGVLKEHLELLKEETGKSWEDEGFDPSLAATQMMPYAIDALRTN